MVGHCDIIIIMLNKNNSYTVENNNQDSLINIHFIENIFAVELIFNKLHISSKFNKNVYKYFCGFYDVGAFVVNALFKNFKVTIFRNDKIFNQVYQRSKSVILFMIIGTTQKHGIIMYFYSDL